MITFHPSEDGRMDYLDFHTPEGDTFYLERPEARQLAEAILAAPDITPGPAVRYRLCSACMSTAPVEQDGLTMAAHSTATPWSMSRPCPGAGALVDREAS